MELGITITFDDGLQVWDRGSIAEFAAITDWDYQRAHGIASVLVD